MLLCALDYVFCREKVVGLMMTAADLCAVCKLWPVQQETVKYIYEEFYEQVRRFFTDCNNTQQGKSHDLPDKRTN